MQEVGRDLSFRDASTSLKVRIWSGHPRWLLKPPCSSEMAPTASLYRMTLALTMMPNILPTTHNRLMGRKLEGSKRESCLCRRNMTLVPHRSGHTSLSNTKLREVEGGNDGVVAPHLAGACAIGSRLEDQYPLPRGPYQIELPRSSPNLADGDGSVQDGVVKAGLPEQIQPFFDVLLVLVGLGWILQASSWSSIVQ